MNNQQINNPQINNPQTVNIKEIEKALCHIASASGHTNGTEAAYALIDAFSFVVHNGCEVVSAVVENGWCSLGDVARWLSIGLSCTAEENAN
jgi:hypothetical protein